MGKRTNHRWLATAAIACTLAAGCAAPAATPEPKRAPAKTYTHVCFVGLDENWFWRGQASDGSFAGVDGKPDLVATCLATLALLGDGSTMRAGPDKVQIKKAVMWLRKAQRADGTFANGVSGSSPQPNSTLRHALATYTLIEAAGLSTYRLLWDYATPALNALLALRSDDGGWRSDPSQPHGDVQTTALASLACMSARSFDHATAEQPWNLDLMRWFDEHPATTGQHAAMELFCRHVAGQDKGQLADLVLADATLDHPVECFWSSSALYLAGGEHWKTWQQQMEPITETAATDPESEHYQSIAPAGGQSRAGTTALRALTLQFYYRYTRLIR